MQKKRFAITIEKRSVNQLNTSIAKEHIGKLIRKAIGKTFRLQGWDGLLRSIDHDPTTEGHNYAATLHFTKHMQRVTDKSESVFDSQREDIVRKLVSGGRSLGWNWIDPNGHTKPEDKGQQSTPPKSPSRFEIPAFDPSHFSRIYNRDAQIRLVRDSLQAAIDSDFQTRNHCLLWGLPACGKTSILLAFEQMIGSDNIIKLDATMTTKAGAENLILQLERIPPVLIIEEAEKCNPMNLPWLLGILDQRGELIKTNARVGSVRREAHCLCLATVNNLTEFKGIMAGALASRFAHKIYCPRPNREILERILAREVERMNGNPAWIQPALDYVLTVEKTDDPRRAISILDGRDRLLDGSYQRDLMEIHKAMLSDNIQF